jgi:hypothetical protein
MYKLTALFYGAKLVRNFSAYTRVYGNTDDKKKLLNSEKRKIPNKQLPSNNQILT